MLIDIRVPSAGESITQVELARWLVEDGAYVEKDQEIAEIDSDKATLTINAEQAGKIRISVEEGTTTEPGKIIGQIDTEAAAPAASTKQEEAPAPETKQEAPPEEKPKASPAAAQPEEKKTEPAQSGFTFSPQAQKLLDELGVRQAEVHPNPDGRRITRKDILAAIAGEYQKTTGAGSSQPASPATATWGGSRNENRQKMSTLRKKVAERLVAVKNQTAMLTTFNEVDMSAILDLRKQYQKAFQEKYGLKLGMMSFFAKAITEAIPHFPQVNGRIEDNAIVLPEFADVGIAVSTPKGLMVPVIRNAEQLSIPELELKIAELAQKARDNKISIEELTGGTISITNGGVFGSMLSTPIINPPQSAILGMHNIVERPVAINGRVEIRPVMYLALSYDHRIVDGKESVGFLVKVKEMVEHPERMLFGGHDPMGSLLGL
ncbi:MAG: 2-oxoglutarate dehydrogenase complex dihydrolipoyllysine-residue succinyltransferase [Bacteroides sp.]|jgi:2-oxoglutarate dehydrogenase E2 component (dihydrolipoamide succinyltransferase)|nr:2-oxoglutarate dehydrogenase complex dihydrolipoyllysine-residue succinyltransferase [Bacteroides sp.]